MNDQPNVRGLLFLFIAIVTISVGSVYAGCWIDGYCPSTKAPTETEKQIDCHRMGSDCDWELACLSLPYRTERCAGKIGKGLGR